MKLRQAHQESSTRTRPAASGIKNIAMGHSFPATGRSLGRSLTKDAVYAPQVK
jgi:hypothetical protein